MLLQTTAVFWNCFYWAKLLRDPMRHKCAEEMSHPIVRIVEGCGDGFRCMLYATAIGLSTVGAAQHCSVTQAVKNWGEDREGGRQGGVRYQITNALKSQRLLPSVCAN